MKPLRVLARIIFVGCLWSVVFIEGVRVIMLENWRFDIFWLPHWMYAWNLWLNGWVIDTAKEWAFVLILLAFIPLWLTGWVSLSMVAWESLAYKLITMPFMMIKKLFTPIKIVTTKAPIIVKKKSYKEIRPTGPRAPIYDYNDSTDTLAQPLQSKPAAPLSYQNSLASTPKSPVKQRAEEARETFSHSLFNLDDDEDDFELDFGGFDKPDVFETENKAPKQNTPLPPKTEFDETPAFEFDGNINNEPEEVKNPRRSDNQKKNTQNRQQAKNSNRDNTRNDRPKREDKPNRRNNNGDSPSASRPSNPVADVLSQKGYDIISNITVRNNIIDFAGVAEDKICVCLIDKEAGDWLADEERFNNEEPLWFSESSHRISPVRKVDIARKVIEQKLAQSDYEMEIKPFVVVQSGNIINAEDMFEIWQDMGIEVTRINRGSPKEIKLFSKTVEEVENKMDKDRFNELKKLLKNLA